MSKIYSEVRRLLPGNWSVITPPTTPPVLGDWRIRQDGTGSTSTLVYEVYDGSVYVSKSVTAQ